MKEVTYEEWQKNPTPRMMWVWNDDETDKIQQKVVYVIKRQGCTMYPVRTTINNDIDYEAYKHCAEIEKQRRMTNKELSRWLREKATREFTFLSNCCSYVYSVHAYEVDCADEEVRGDVVIREDDGEWREPLVEVEEVREDICIREGDGEKKNVRLKQVRQLWK